VAQDNERQFSWQQFMRETQEALLAPATHFRELRTELPLSIPVLKSIIYGILTGVVAWVWAIAGFGPAVFEQEFTATAAFAQFLLQTAFTVIGLWLVALIVWGLAALGRGDHRFSTAVHIAGSLLVFAPISMLLRGTATLHETLPQLLNIILLLYVTVETFMALTHTVKARPGRALMGLGLLLLLCAILVVVLGYGANQ
jgi:fumarate reductase subunit C